MNKKIKVSIYDKFATETDILTTNGLAILDNICIALNSTEELDSGNYTLDGTFIIDDDGLYNYLQEEYILKVLCDYGYEIFSISKVEKGTRYIDITARQITIAESLGIHLEDVRPENASGQGALSHLLANADNSVRIRLNSDITSTGTAYYQDKSLYEALHTADNSFLNVWGGEIQRRGFDVKINQRIGIDRGVNIREGKNLTGFSGSSNIDSVYTKVRGKGYNGLLGNWQESTLINNYPRVYSKTFEYKVRVREAGQTEDENYTYFDTEEQAKAELDRLAALEFTENEVDKIKADYTINFVELDKTEEYKNYKLAERCYIGDTIRVYIPRMNVDISVRIVKREFNHLTQMVTESELSNYISAKVVSLKTIKDTLEKLSESQENHYKEALDFASNLIKNGNVDSYVVVKKDELLIMDTKDINTATKVWRWNNSGLGFSSTGYNGTYSNAFTSDGQIIADRILTGVLTSILIKSLDGKSYFDLSSGSLVLGNGNITVNNSSGDKTMWVSSSGYLSCNSLEAVGAGKKFINFSSSDAKDTFVYLKSGSGKVARIGFYENDDKLFIECNKEIVFRNINSTSSENKPVTVHVYGEIKQN